MKTAEILYYAEINNTDAEKVNEIIESIRNNGWQGAPILVMESSRMLITGSHRLAALKVLDDECFDLDSLGDVAEPVDDIINSWCEDNDTCIDDIRYDCLSSVFSGTWVEQYKDEIAEW